MNNSGTYGYEYVLRDHLGNTRVTFGDADNSGTIANSEIKQINSYYPFGLNMEGPGFGVAGANKYQYNGKEWNNDFGLGWNDYGARFYDAAVARWNVVDLLSSKHEDMTPYNYVMNNPIKMIDPIGLDTAIFGLISGKMVSNDGKTDDSGKNPVYVVDESAKGKKKPIPLKYSIKGRDNAGISGKSYRDNHPLKDKGSKAGKQVYLEDLLDMTKEFNSLTASAFKDFTWLQSINGPGRKKMGFADLVGTDAKYDLKSAITNDGTESYAAINIGEWSLYDGKLTQYDDYGNILYGYMGHYSGFSENELLRSSNIQQTWHNIKHFQWGGDVNRDAIKISEGFRWYSQKPNP